MIRTTIATLLLMNFWLLGCAEDKALDDNLSPIREDFDQAMEASLKEFAIPGLAVGVVKDGKVIYLKGFGQRDKKQALPVDADTLFAFGSTTKAMTATMLGILADEGKVRLDKPVLEYLPDFQLAEKEATEQVTLQHLLTHRSGLPRHDFVWYGTPFTRNEIFARLRYLPLSRPFGTTWQYSNLSYMAAGLVAEKVENKSWEQLIREKLFLPLGMGRSNTSIAELEATANTAKGYAFNGKELVPVPYRSTQGIAPAGAVNSSVREMLSWVRLNLEGGRFEGRQIISGSTLRTIHSPRVQISSSKNLSYALGWMVGEYENRRVITHNGAIDGFYATVALLPNHGVGVVVVANRGIGFPEYAAKLIYDRMLGLPAQNWIQTYRDDLKKASEKKQPEKPKSAKPDPPLGTEKYLGVYQHPGYGEFEVIKRGNSLYMKRYDILEQKIEHLEDNVFWFPGLAVDSRAQFKSDGSGSITRLEIRIEPLLKDPQVFIKVREE